MLARVEAALKTPLPGSAAQVVMMPQPPREWPSDFDPALIRNAAGLLLLFPLDNNAHLVLTERAGSLGRHGGQISLPGGAVDPGETFEQAALREAHEEIGLEPAGVRILGALTPLDIHVSGFRLHPIVAAINRRPELRSAYGEVARILEVPVHRLADRGNVKMRTLTRDNRSVAAPTFVIGDAEIWGATAMVLAEFLAMI